MPSETIGKTIGVAAAVCVVCSIFVSTTAVLLKPAIDRNKTVDKRRNILIAAGIPGADDLDAKGVEKAFEVNIETVVIDITTGERVPETEVDPAELDERKAAKDPDTRVPIPDTPDDPGLKWRSRHQSVYLTKEGSDDPRVILPVHGKGLWSTMYGFVALHADDLNTIRAFAFYDHGETPGLGGEIVAAWFRDQFVGKSIVDAAGSPGIIISMGGEPAENKVDGISGATMTCDKLQAMLNEAIKSIVEEK